MNITWGFINTSQQTPKIMKARSGSRRRQLLELLLLYVYSAPACQRRRLLITPRLGSPLRCVAGEAQGGRRAPPGPAHLQHKWTELIVHVQGDGGAAHTVQCLQNMEIINLIELVKYHQCCKRGFEHGLGMRRMMIAMGWIDADV